MARHIFGGTLVAAGLLASGLLVPAAPAQEPHADLSQVRHQPNVLRDGKPGVLITLNARLSNLSGKLVWCSAYFRYEQRSLGGKAAPYRTPDGSLAVQVQQTPGQAVVDWNGIELFLPYAEINLPTTRTYNLTFHVQVQYRRNGTYAMLADSGDFSFSYPPAPVASEMNRRVHVVLVGVTGDRNIGKNAAYNLEQLKTLFEGGLNPEHLGTMVMLRGNDATARKVLETIDRLNVTADEALFVYCHIHGGYDPKYQGTDPEQGHFFQLAGGDLLRRDLWQHLRARKAGLTVLVSESCNVHAQASPFPAPAVRFQLIRENPALVALFLRQRGYLDINASSRDESSWNYGGGQGSFFTNALVELFYPHPGSPITDRANVTWPQLLSAAGTKADKIYREHRQAVLANPGTHDKNLVDHYRAQAEQHVAILQIRLATVPLKERKATYRTLRQTSWLGQSIGGLPVGRNSRRPGAVSSIQVRAASV